MPPRRKRSNSPTPVTGTSDCLIPSKMPKANPGGDTAAAGPPTVDSIFAAVSRATEVPVPVVSPVQAVVYQSLSFYNNCVLRRAVRYNQNHSIS